MAEEPRVQLFPTLPASFPLRVTLLPGIWANSPFALTALGDPNKAKLKGPI